MVNLDVQLWELGTQRLHQGLSETIFVNTLTDVREFQKMAAPSKKCYIALNLYIGTNVLAYEDCWC